MTLKKRREATWGLSKALRAVAIPETYSGLWFTVTTEQLVKVHHNWDGSTGPFHTSSGFSIKVVKRKKKKIAERAKKEKIVIIK